MAGTVKAFSRRSLLSCTITLCLIQPGVSFLLLIACIVAVSERFFFSSSSVRKGLVLNSRLQFFLVYLAQTRHGSRMDYVEIVQNFLSS